MTPEANDEHFKVAYVDKATCRNVQVWPVPDDLENWYEIPFDTTFKYRGKVYSPETGTWCDCAEAKRKKAIAQRKAAYAAESDPLYMEYQYDQTPESEQRWREAVAAIKQRYPLT
ncbi:hypothetical protein JYB87_11795 [Shewanella avicenniae]|uniref:Uncharacterized protein n=1 Tax=Shewanella avicenniae TaxID=2814294 RepID=A0ABX7QMG7_9GAMM|nr:hypothetical protein [Shewanella avicenniae]QSX32449.1 hypothetical protein JYB87_11795 [Shewanella avicenniae]